MLKYQDRPIFLDPVTDKNNFGLTKEKLVTNERYSDLLKELFKIENPDLAGKPEYDQKLQNYLESRRINDLSAGRWLYLPWRNSLTHILDEPEYYKVRTARNQHLITATEQTAFRNSKIGIVGLSVGNNVALTLAMTGGPKFMKLADPDTLDLSNLNRLRGSIFYLGERKTTIAAHQLWEIDPDMDIELWDEGLSESSLEKFISDPKVDLVVDEMDDLRLKILIRIKAKKAQIPVIMATDNDDGVLLDVERFDLEPDRPILHGLIEDIDYKNLGEELSLSERVTISSKLVGREYISENMQKSLEEIGKSIPTWPQLGTAAAMSGAVAAYAARRIVTDQGLASQRVLITPNRLMK